MRGLRSHFAQRIATPSRASGFDAPFTAGRLLIMRHGSANCLLVGQRLGVRHAGVPATAECRQTYPRLPVLDRAAA